MAEFNLIVVDANDCWQNWRPYIFENNETFENIITSIISDEDDNVINECTLVAHSNEINSKNIDSNYLNF